MPTTYRVGITRREGAVDGWVFDLPGCRAIGGSVDEVTALLPVVIAEHLAWLDEHGDVTRDAFPFTVEVDQEVTLPTGEFVFGGDKAPFSAAALERAIAHVGFAHSDLVTRLRPLPDSILDWKPPASAVKIDAIYPDVRSIREMLPHVGESLLMYTGNVGDTPASAPSTPPGLFDAPHLAFERLRALGDEKRSGVFKRLNARGIEGEWTARKALRRMVNHVRFHTREVEQRLCWLTLGVPEVLPVSRE